MDDDDPRKQLVRTIQQLNTGNYCSPLDFIQMILLQYINIICLTNWSQDIWVFQSFQYILKQVYPWFTRKSVEKRCNWFKAISSIYIFDKTTIFWIIIYTDFKPLIISFSESQDSWQAIKHFHSLSCWSQIIWWKKLNMIHRSYWFRYLQFLIFLLLRITNSFQTN